MPLRVWSNRQYLWIEIFYAASSVAVVSSGRSTSLPFSNFAPARTSATRWGALTARQRDWAASISLWPWRFQLPASPGLLVILLRFRTVAKVDSIGFVVLR